MIALVLFLTFFGIGAVSFGGGYGMIPLIKETVIGNGWLTESDFVSLIAVSESTPGPLAVNMATYIGATVGGLSGAILSTVGVVMPSFCIILTIAALSGKFASYTWIRSTADAFLTGVHPCVVGMIFSTAIGMGMTTLFGFTESGGSILPDFHAILILILLVLADYGYRRLRKRTLSPICLILVSSFLGILFF